MEDLIADRINRPIELGRFLTSPGESQEAEYKAAIAFDATSNFGLALVKHALGMANAGGGVIIIGYTDSPLSPDPDHTDEIARTYDTTRLANAVNKRLRDGQEIQLSVHTLMHPETKRLHPVIQVQGFDKLPLICKSDMRSSIGNGDRILRQGAIYIRRRNGSTSEVQTPQDIEILIKRCVAQKRDEFLAQFVDLYQRMSAGISEIDMDIKAVFGKWVKEARESSTTVEFLPDGHGYLESAHMLLTPSAYPNWEPLHLVHAMQEAKLSRYSGWPMGIIMDSGKFAPIPKANGIEIRVEDGDEHSDYWRLDSDGSYYFSRFIREDYDVNSIDIGVVPGRKLGLELSIINITEAILHSVALYKALGVAPDVSYLFTIAYKGLSGRILAQRMPYLSAGIAQEDSFSWQKELTQDLVSASLKDLVFEAVKSLVVMFNFASVPKGFVDGLIDQFMEGRT